jgi:hypothetical protein
MSSGSGELDDKLKNWNEDAAIRVEERVAS